LFFKNWALVVVFFSVFAWVFLPFSFSHTNLCIVIWNITKNA
jgi:hypothetical protein